MRRQVVVINGSLFFAVKEKTPGHRPGLQMRRQVVVINRSLFFAVKRRVTDPAYK